MNRFPELLRLAGHAVGWFVELVRLMVIHLSACMSWGETICSLPSSSSPTPSSSTSSPNRIHHVNILGASTQVAFPTLQMEQTDQLLHTTRMEAKEHTTPPPLSSIE